MRIAAFFLMLVLTAWVGYWSGFDRCFRINHDENIAQAKLNVLKIETMRKWLREGDMEKVRDFLDVDIRLNEAFAADAHTPPEGIVVRARQILWPSEYMQYIEVERAQSSRNDSSKRTNSNDAPARP